MSDPVSPIDTAAEIRVLFGDAVRLHEAGRLNEAEACYRRILVMDSRHADSLHLLGVLAYQKGQSCIAADLIGSAIGINGEVAAYHSNRGNALKDLGRLDDALASYDTALNIEPDYADAHYNRGTVLTALGRPAEALAAFDATLRIKPAHAKAHSNRGNVLHDLGRLDEALASYDAALRLAPDYAVAHSNRANVLKHLGRLDEALASYDAALRVRPDYVEALDNRAKALKDYGRFEEALASCDAALRLKPDSVEAHSNRGNVLTALGRVGEALTSYDAALRINPDHVETHHNRGNALAILGRVEDALASYDAALRIRPDHVEAHTNRGHTLKDLDRFDEALASYDAALRIKPDFIDAHSSLISCLHYGPDIAAVKAAARRFGALFEPAPASFANLTDPGRRLRVGLVSGDFGRHPVGYFLLPFLVNHSRADMEIFCYSAHPRNDALTAALQESAGRWRNIVGMTDDAAAKQIRSDAIDVLVDLSGHTAHNRLPLFALRPAPVQATWLGYWGTTGLPAMDYILSDPATIPPGQEGFYTEQVLRLPDSRFCYAPPRYAPEPAPPPCLRDGVVTFGSFNHLGKVGHRVVALWAAVLAAVPGARLLLKWRSLADEPMRRRLTEAFAAHGIAAHRLVLRAASPHPRMLAEYGDMDIALDPFPFSGGLTSCEALWMGVPVVTLPGETGPSRQTLGFLKALKLDGWAAADTSDYVRIAAGLAADREHLGGLRQSLRSRIAASPLGDGPAFARNVEAALRTMWRNWCAQTSGLR